MLVGWLLKAAVARRHVNEAGGMRLHKGWDVLIKFITPAILLAVIGFALYYYVLKHLDASRVALVTLITPVLALLLGHLLNGEVIEARVGVGKVFADIT